MKRRFGHFLFCAVLLSLLCGCVKDHSGEGVDFSAFATGFARRGSETRTAYSGVVTSGAERIDWVDNDLLLVWSDNASATDLDDGTRYSEYRVIRHSDYSPTVSRAVLMPSDGLNGMQWGTGDHTFYAMYPSPRIPGLDGASFVDGEMGFTIPGSGQCAAPSIDTEQRLVVCAPLMQYAPMLSRSATVPSGTREVNLTFVPQYTAFEFTIAKGGNESVTLSGFHLTAADVDADGNANGYLTGTFSIPADGYNDPSQVSVSSGGRSVDLDWSAAPIVLDAQNPAVRVTVHVLPQAISSLTIGFDCSLATVENGVSKVVDTTCSLLLQDNDRKPLGFAPYKKYCLYSLYVPVLIGTHTDDSILWDHSITILDNVTWWISADPEDLGWFEGLDYRAIAFTPDKVDWWTGGAVTDVFDYLDDRMHDGAANIPDHAAWWLDANIPEGMNDSLDYSDPGGHSDSGGDTEHPDDVGWWVDGNANDGFTYERFGGIEMSTDPVYLWLNESYTRPARCTVAGSDETYYDATIRWSSSVPSSVQVNPVTGEITAVGNQLYTVITATATPNDGSAEPVTASYVVSIYGIRSITLASATMQLSVGERRAFSYVNMTTTGVPIYLYPDDTFVWSSSDPSVAVPQNEYSNAVTNNNIIATGPGTTVITVRVNPRYDPDGPDASCTIEVTE